MIQGDLVARAEATIAAGSRSFAAASRLFDPATRESAVLLYAWCRHLDDVVDGQELGFAAGPGPAAGPRPAAGARPAADPAARIAELEDRTRAVLAGEPGRDLAFAALAEVVARHGLPARYPLRHLAGFRMDAEGRVYETLADTLDYAYHVAGVVGVMMAWLMGVRDPAVLRRASDLGLAFQLTNIARDVVPDAGEGRLYLPARWLAEAGIPPGRVGDPAHREALAAVAARLVAAAEPYYASALVGIAHLPLRSAWAIATARGVYRRIGLEVRRRGASAWDERVTTSGAAKLGQVGRGLATAMLSRLGGRETPRNGLHEPPP